MKEPTAVDALDFIQQILMRNDEESRALWSMLTALRGPDWPSDSDLKDNTTAVIRTACFPELANINRYIPADFAPHANEGDIRWADRQSSKARSTHFSLHIQDAVKCLFERGRYQKG